MLQYSQLYNILVLRISTISSSTLITYLLEHNLELTPDIQSHSKIYESITSTKRDSPVYMMGTNVSKANYISRRIDWEILTYIRSNSIKKKRCMQMR